MKYTIIGDIHAKVNNLNKVDQLFGQIEKLGNPVIILGDLLDSKAIIRSECLNFYYNKFNSSNLNYYILVGNHDLHNVHSSEHSLTTLKSLKNVKIFDSITKYKNFLFIPYIHDSSVVNRVLNDANTKINFMHASINGFYLNENIQCRDGVSDIPTNKIIISGHFHKYQNKGNVTYIGSPFTHNFGESNQRKYIGILEDEILTRVDTYFPMHQTVEIDCNEINEFDVLEYNKEYTRFILRGSSESINNFKTIKGYKYISKPNDIVNNSVIISDSICNIKQFETWAKDVKNLNAEIVDLGKSILENLNSR